MKKDQAEGWTPNLGRYAVAPDALELPTRWKASTLGMQQLTKGGGGILAKAEFRGGGGQNCGGLWGSTLGPNREFEASETTS